VFDYVDMLLSWLRMSQLTLKALHIEQRFEFHLNDTLAMSTVDDCYRCFDVVVHCAYLRVVVVCHALSIYIVSTFVNPYLEEKLKESSFF
jgi:hypothetical protein